MESSRSYEDTVFVMDQNATSVSNPQTGRKRCLTNQQTEQTSRRKYKKFQHLPEDVAEFKRQKVNEMERDRQGNLTQDIKNLKPLILKQLDLPGHEADSKYSILKSSIYTIQQLYQEISTLRTMLGPGDEAKSLDSGHHKSGVQKKEIRNASKLPAFMPIFGDGSMPTNGLGSTMNVGQELTNTPRSGIHSRNMTKRKSTKRTTVSDPPIVDQQGQEIPTTVSMNPQPSGVFHGIMEPTKIVTEPDVKMRERLAPNANFLYSDSSTVMNENVSFDTADSEPFNGVFSGKVLDENISSINGFFNGPNNNACPGPSNGYCNAPFNRAYDTPINGAYIVPINQGYNAPTNQIYNAPVNQAYNAPVNQAYNAPVNQAYNAPVNQAYNAPINQDYNTPTNQDYNAPMNGACNTAINQAYNVPMDGANNAPNNADYNAPLNEANNALFKTAYYLPTNVFNGAPMNAPIHGAYNPSTEQLHNIPCQVYAQMNTINNTGTKTPNNVVHNAVDANKTACPTSPTTRQSEWDFGTSSPSVDTPTCPTGLDFTIALPAPSEETPKRSANLFDDDYVPTFFDLLE